MNRRTLPRIAAALLLVPLSFAAAQSLSGTVKAFKATLQRHPNGRVRTQLFAESATTTADNHVDATDVRILILTPDGDIECTLESDRVLVDVDARTGHCPNHVYFERHTPHRRDAEDYPEDGVSIEGDNVEWFGDRNQIIVNSNAVIHIYREGKTLAEGWT